MPGCSFRFVHHVVPRFRESHYFSCAASVSPSAHSSQVTASERAVNKEAGTGSMDSVSPRGSKRTAEEGRSGEDARQEREHNATEKGEEVVEVDGDGDGDAIAIRGDLEACKRNEVIASKTHGFSGWSRLRMVRCKAVRVRCSFVGFQFACC